MDKKQKKGLEALAKKKRSTKPKAMPKPKAKPLVSREGQAALMRSAATAIAVQFGENVSAEMKESDNYDEKSRNDVVDALHKGLVDLAGSTAVLMMTAHPSDDKGNLDGVSVFLGGCSNAQTLKFIEQMDKMSLQLKAALVKKALDTGSVSDAVSLLGMLRAIR